MHLQVEDPWHTENSAVDIIGKCPQEKEERLELTFHDIHRDKLNIIYAQTGKPAVLFYLCIFSMWLLLFIGKISQEQTAFHVMQSECSFNSISK